MANNERDKVFKSWSGISEVALIKEVATKGEHIQLCIQYWARKRKMSVTEYELFFHDVVQNYVNRLLTERLVCKAENVLRNVQRDVICFYYQFACESNDLELRELIMEHLVKKQSCKDYDDLLQNLKFHWELLQQLKKSETIMLNIKKHMKRVNLESLINLDSAALQRLMIELYFETHNDALLQHINKFVMWDFLVETKQIADVIRWCRIQFAREEFKTLNNLTELELKYLEWSIDTEMYKYAIRSMHDNSDNVLRNLFASAGFFFDDERNSVKAKLQRICLTESFKVNTNNIKCLPFASFLFDQKLYYLLLYEFVEGRQLEELVEISSKNRPLLKLLFALKMNSLQSLEGFKEISFYATKYLENVGIDFEREQALATLFEFLTTDSSISDLQCASTSGTLKSLTYLKIIHHQQQNETANTIELGLPNAYDLIKTFHDLDVKRLAKDACLYEKFLRNSEHSKQDSNPVLQYTCRLNFLHYIKQSRCAYAVYLMLLKQLQNYAQITESHLFSACECVYDMALQSVSDDTETISHCIGFCEMIGFDTQQLRCFLKLKKCLNNDEAEHSQSVTSILQKSERLLVNNLENGVIFPLNEFTAIMFVSAIARSMQSTATCSNQVSLVMKYYAELNDYWRLLVLLQYFEIPLDQIKNLVKYFNIPAIGDHLLRALSFAPRLSERNLKRRTSITRRHLKQNKQRKKENKTAVTTTSMETVASSLISCNEPSGTVNVLDPNNDQFVTDWTNGGPDLFALIILNTNDSKGNHVEILEDINKFLECMQQTQNRTTMSTVVNYLRTSVEQKLPIMSVLAASINGKDKCNIDWCWLVWLSVTTNQWNNVLRFAVGINIQEFPWNFIEQLVRRCQIKPLVRSFCIFYPHNPIIHLFKFLQLTVLGDFSDKAVHELRLYALAWSNDEARLPLNPWTKREKLVKRTIRLLLLHLHNNFESITYQMKFLTCVCQSGLSDITGQLDFCLLRAFCEILQSAGNAATQRFPINFIELIQNQPGDMKEYERVLNSVLEAKEYDIAVRLASLLHKPISDIVYSKWANALEMQLSLPTLDKFDNYIFPFKQYEQEVSSHSLPPETLVNFLLYASSRLPSKAFRSRYYVLQKALNFIKHHHLFPNESFDRDQIEYDMILNYLLLTEDEASTLPLYHSEYYEEIMLMERCVLYKSFVELKEVAGIEDLNISSKINLDERQKNRLESLLHSLLDDGDIVEALRLQELFDVRPLDLRFVVFCMALAESMSNINGMSSDERLLLAEIERSSFSKFTKITLCTTSGVAGGSHSTDSVSTLEFEEVPSKEKQETLALLQGIASKLKFGVTIAKRIICCYRAAMYLDKEYLDVLRTKDVQILLQSVAEEDCLHRLLVVSDILTSTHMEPQEIAELLAFEITTAVVRPRFYIFSADQQAKHMFRNAALWGYNIDRDLHLFLELTPDRTKLGACLLEYCDGLKLYRKYQDNKPFDKNIYFERLAEIITKYGQPSTSSNSANANLQNNEVVNSSTRTLQVLSHKKQNIIYVELLIKAHQAFVHECSMEGIANVLNRAKALNTTLSQAKSWSLIVRMLIGIGRYREMFFCFDTLIENEQFESLLGQFDIEKTISLRQAILAYLREYCAPQQGKELFKLAALNFLMYKDLAELWERDSEELLNKVYNTCHFTDDTNGELSKLKCNVEMINHLNLSLEYYVHASENYLLDNKILLAQKSAALAELTAMQIDLANKALAAPATPSGLHICICVINLKSRDHFRMLANNELSVCQTLILSRAYGYDINWSEALIYQFVINLKRSYMNDFLQEVKITDDIIENAIKCFQTHGHQQTITKEMEKHLIELVDMVESVTLKYKLASLLTLKSTILSLINDQTIYYLRDMKFGRREENQNT